MQRYENHWHELVKEDTGRFFLYSEAMEKIEKKDMDIERLDALAFERLQIIAEQAKKIAYLQNDNEDRYTTIQRQADEISAWREKVNELQREHALEIIQKAEKIAELKAEMQRREDYIDSCLV